MTRLEALLKYNNCSELGWSFLKIYRCLIQNETTMVDFTTVSKKDLFFYIKPKAIRACQSIFVFLMVRYISCNISIYCAVFPDARGKIVIVVRNGPGTSHVNPLCSCLRFTWGRYRSISSLASYGLIVG